MINWNQFTVTNGAITDLKELLFTAAFKDPDLDLFFTNKTGLQQGQRLGYVDSIGDVGIAGAGCDPEYSDVDVKGIEKEWRLDEWEIAKHLCYKDLENTIAESSMKTGTEIAELEGTPYWDQVLMPLLKKAIVEMYWRIVWFSDKNAASVSDGGKITDGVNIKLLKVCDGFFKRLGAIIAANPSQRTTITANDASVYDTTAKQMAAMKANGYAIGVMDDLLYNADSRIFDNPNASVVMTNSFFKALRKDVINKYGEKTMPFEYVSAGITLSEYDGRKLIAIDVWDRMIRKYENNGTTLNNPHRAIVYAPNNLFVGTNATDKISSLSVTFNDETRYNNIYAAGKIGTLIGEDELIQYAI